ncbi:L-threonylcarbamoyladenylate synthase [Patescibacteria group bacterium]|nr:L-threonylcarbamoyladenylate synthase [Patescibacteria group bacterium]
MEVLKVNRKNFKKTINKAIELIKKGEVIVCPTDTVYGLIADATNEKAVEKVFKIKRRPKGKPIPIFVRDLKMAKRLVEINKEGEKILKKIWPGKVTAVFKKKEKIKVFGASPKTIGLRIPNHKLVNILLSKLNRPLTGTSANISGKPASTKIGEVTSQFKNQKFLPDLVLNGGNLKKSLPSTIIDLTKKKPKILRKGEIIP